MTSPPAQDQTTLRPLGGGERLFHLWTRDHPLHFSVAAEVDGVVAPEELRAALSAVQHRHPLLAKEAAYLPPYLAPGGMRAGFQHYGTLVEDGKANRAAFRGPLPMPVLVLNGERGIPQAQTLGGVRRAAERVEADLVPGGGHTFAEDNPAWVAERLARSFA